MKMIRDPVAGRGESRLKNVSPKLSGQKPVSGKVTVAFGAESNVLDVTKAAAGVDWYYISQVNEMLMAATAKMEIENWLAESWKLIQVDGKPVIDVFLRKGVKFHTGDTMTSKDFAFCYDRMKDPKISKWSHYQASVDRIKIIDDYNFQIHFKVPDATYIPSLLRLYGISKAYYGKVGDDGVQRHPVGTGPWKFVSRRVKEGVEFEAFEDYWNQKYRPGVKYLSIKIIPEDMTRVAAFQTKAVDLIDAVPPAMIASIKKIKGVQTASVINGNNLFLQFNTQIADSPFNDQRVRLAAAYAIDMDGIIKGVLFGQGQRYASIGRGNDGYDPSLKPYEYNPEKAKALLKEAGYPKGFDITFYNLITPREPNIKEYGEAMAAYLTAVGIKCRIQGLEYSPWIKMGRRADKPEMDGVISWMWGHGLTGDPGLSPWPGHLHSYHAGTGWGSYSYSNDPEIDKMIEEQKVTMDPVKRMAIIKQIARLKHERVVGGLTTYRPMVTFAWRDHVSFTPWPAGYFHELRQIGLK
ncbi:MAG: ABC transporter substrate-binding protein [Deltaproteobacteria bacterium]|nr:ABC transporter substrate-binding protein [Deltaproteobacteria bacterium]